MLLRCRDFRFVIHPVNGVFFTDRNTDNDRAETLCSFHDGIFVNRRQSGKITVSYLILDCSRIIERRAGSVLITLGGIRVFDIPVYGFI